MSTSQFCLCRKTLLSLLFVLICLPVVGLAQSSVQNKDADKALLQNFEFKNAALKSLLTALCKQIKVEVVYDELVQSSKVNLDLKDETMKAAIKIILDQHHLQAREIEEKKVIVFPDNEANRLKYEAYKVWPEESKK
jgi:hypothetical protein